jgi:hypothetical protein
MLARYSAEGFNRARYHGYNSPRLNGPNGIVNKVFVPILTTVLTLLACEQAHGDENNFDGVWDTVLSCSNSNGALGYSFEFDSIVKSSVLHGEKGTKDQPGWLQLDGNISADGSGSLYVKGRVGAAAFAVGQRPAGTEYGYHIEAKLTNTSGTGHRVEGRPCTVVLNKRA